MTLNTDISTALHLLEHVHKRVEDCDDPKLQLHTSQDLQSLISLLEDPVFRSIVTIQDSLAELNNQLGQHPSILPGDFEINLGGQLQFSVPNTPIQPVGQAMYQNLYQESNEIEDQRVPVASLIHTSNEDTSAQVASPSLTSDVIGMPPIMTPTYAKEFQKVIETAAKGRQIFTVQLFKSEGTSLGFSVVGLRSKDRGELGIFLQEIQPNGIAGSDGRLLEGDQILAIDGQPLDSNISHEQAISILQKARGLVELIVARSAQDIGSSVATDELSGVPVSSAAAAAVGAGAGGGGGGGVVVVAGGSPAAAVLVGAPDKEAHQSLAGPGVKLLAAAHQSAPPPAASAPTPTPLVAASAQPQPQQQQQQQPSGAQAQAPPGGLVERSNSAVSDASKSGDMVLNTEWAQVEVINLINDGSGLGFGIIGGRSTGVVVKTILPGGVADRDNRLQSGDHILQIGEVNLRGMGSEQVAAVLRQSGTHVRLVVARPVEPTSPDYQALGGHAPIVPTKILGDPDELDRYLLRSGADAHNQRRAQGDAGYDNGGIYGPDSELDVHGRASLVMDGTRNSMPLVGSSLPIADHLPVLSMDPLDVNALPEMERFNVELKKDSCGLGITIAGYVCEKEELSGIFVKSISEGSAADLSKKIQINDRIVEVNGHSLQGYSNHEAVEVLRSTGQTVTLCLERYLRGPKYEQLQQAIAASELKLPQPSSPSITSLPTFPISADDTTLEIEPEGESHTTVDSAVLQEIDRDALMGSLDEISNVEALLSDPSTEMTPNIEAAIKVKWQKIVGPDIEIVVAQLKKFAEGSGLGISLEGTVDVENGQEVRPHHYIRSILPEGPVGQNGILRSGDELLEVNGYRLLGINHMEVVSVLKELPIHVRMVCGRNIASQDLLCPIDTAQHQAAFQTRSILGGSLQNLLPTSDRLVKAKSDGSLASTTTTATVTDASLNKMKSRSLEPLTGLAMWSSEPQIIELIKGERGLGFSILDYQDPMNPNETVIVIRSLVPGGVAQVDGQLIPGDRLLFVNDIALENATLDQAVQALKGAPKGIVRIGVAKPLPIPDSIAQRLAPICIVRRSKSLPDSEAAASRVAAARAVGAGVHLDDFLSSGTEVLEDAGVAAVEERRSAERRPAQVQDLGLLGLARRKDEAPSFEPHSPLIKLTPFLEEQRRALLSGVPEAETTENGEDDFDSARLLDAGATPPKRRRSTPCGEPSGGGIGGGGGGSIGSTSISLLRKRSCDPGAESASLGSAFRGPLRPLGQPRPASAGPPSDGEAGPETTEPTGEPLLAPEVAAVSGRRSSLRRRREDRGDEPGAQEEPGPDAPAAEPVKKTVRISSVEEEIRIESLDPVDPDDLGGLGGQPQEVGLVTARTLGAEELATDEDGWPSGREEDLGSWTSRLRQFTDRPEDAAEDDEEAARMAPQRAEPDSRLRPPPCLKPSASETALSRERRPEDNRISEKNLRPEILMDLSRVTGDEDESAACSAERVALEEDGRLAATPSRTKRKLSRVSSDGAQLQAELVRFHLGGGSLPDEERTGRLLVGATGTIGRPCVGGSERETTAPSTTERTVESPVAEEAVEGDGLARRRGRPVDEPRPTPRRGSSDASALGEEGEETEEEEEEEEEAAADRPRGLDEAPKEEPPPAPPDDEPDDVFEEARDESFASPATSAASRLSAERGRSPPPPLLVRQGRALGSPAPSEDLVGTDCSSPAALEDLEPESLDCSSTQSLLSASCRSFGSPRREAETQTQGEHKSTQYELEDLAELLCELYDRAAERPRERLGRLLEARFGSPRREAEVQTELESKAVQCVSEELAASGDFGPFRRAGRGSRDSPRREAQVQTGQEAKSTQCRLGELAEEERLRDEDDGDGPPGQETNCSRAPPLASAAASAAAAAAAAGPATECPAARPGSPESSSPPPSGTASPSASSSPRPGEESSSSSPPLILLVKGDPATVDMTVTHRDRDGNVVWAKHWGPERLVEIYREHQTSLGLSIVGGKVDLHDTGNSSKSPNVSGIFIKNVLPNSPAGRAGGLQTGDRIIEVDGVDLRNSTHERAVKAIQAAGNPVRLLVQSLVHLSPENNEEQDGEEASAGGGHRSGERSQGPRTSSVVRRRHDSPMKAGAEAIQEGRPDLKRQSSGATSDAAGPSGRRSSMKKSLRKKAPSPSPGGAGSGALRELSEEPDGGPKSVGPTEAKNKYSSGESSEEEEDARELEGNVYTKNGVEISRKSAGNVKRSKEEIAADPEEEDDFGYTTNKVKKRYANLKEPVFLFKLDRERSGLGISLAGHKDRNKMSVFVCGLNPSGAAFKKGEIKIGDELLEVNGTVFQGRCHLNASSMIKGMPSISYKLVVVRRRSGIDNCAVKQVLHFPTALPGEDFSQYKGVRTVPIKKGTYGLGIMIIEGKHAEVGQGIFVSDIQEGGAAELAGLNVGDMILSVNSDAVTGSTYDEAATLLKKAEGIVTLTVCNPNQSKVAEDEERLARGEPIEPAKDLKLEPEKPKEPEPPADPKTGKIVPNKDTTIEFPKDKDKPIGFSVVGGTDTPSKSVFVLDVFTDGAAGKDGRLQPGDRIVEINKESFKAMEQEKAYQTVLRVTQGPIIMIVHRDEKAVEEIEVELTKKSGKGSGLVLMGYKSGKGAYVSEVVAGGSAAESGKISKGDRVVAIGGQDLREAPVEDIALHVKVSNPLQLKLARYKTK